MGVTTAEIDRVTYEATVSRGAYPSPLNYYNFPCAVCTSVNEVICHGIPDLRCGMAIVNVDGIPYITRVRTGVCFPKDDGVVVSDASTRPHESLRAS